MPTGIKKSFPGERNDHGKWNGQNLNGIDPRLILLEEQHKGAKFSLVNYIRSETELCRVVVRSTEFSLGETLRPAGQTQSRRRKGRRGRLRNRARFQRRGHSN